jgi:hypothetical protein
LKPFDRFDPGSAGPRAQPWTTDSKSRYHDLMAAPALIRTAVEDFVPWAAWPAVDTFDGLVERINGPASSLESNGRGFDGPSGAGPSRHAPRPRRRDFGVVCRSGLTETPESFFLTPEEAQAVAVAAEKNGLTSYWLQPRAYDRPEFREAWQRLGVEAGPTPSPAPDTHRARFTRR